jgi:hypothetical protein
MQHDKIVSKSELELTALEFSLEVELAEVLSVGAVNSPPSLEVEESCSAEVDLPWVINESVHDQFLNTAAACHLSKLFLLI